MLTTARKCAQSNCARAHTHTATATVTVTAPATANTQDDNGCKKRRIAGRTRGKRLLVLMNPLNAPGVVETQCSRPSINGQTGEPWWATCQASSSSANLYQCPYIHAGLQVAFPVTTPAKALPAVPQPTSVLLPLLRYLYTPAGLCRSCVSDEPPHPFASASFHRLILLIVPLPCSSSCATMATMATPPALELFYSTLHYTRLGHSATSDPRRPAENRHCLLLMGPLQPHRGA